MLIIGSILGTILSLGVAWATWEILGAWFKGELK